MEALDRTGRRDRSRSDTVFVEPGPRSDGIAIRTTPSFAVMREGRAEFPTLGVHALNSAHPATTTLRFHAATFGTVDSDPVVLASTLFLDSAIVNGQRLSPAMRAVFFRRRRSTDCRNLWIR